MKQVISETVLQSAVEHAITFAQRQGASGVEVSASAGQGFTTTVRNQALEELEYQNDTGLGITVYKGHRQGVASTGDLSKKAIEQTVKAALDIARFTEEDPCIGLPEKENLAVSWPELELCHAWNITPPEAEQIALECEQAAFDEAKEVLHSEGVSVSTYQSQRVFGNSLGFLNNFTSSRHSLSCSLLAERNGHKERDYDFTVARAPEDLESVGAIAKQAAKKTLNRLGGVKIKTCKVPVIFANNIATGLIGHLLSTISGGNLYRRSSFLVDSLGQTLFPEFMTITDDPFVKRGLASCPYDGEGVQVRKRNLVQQGVLEGYLLSSYSARRLGMQTTGNCGGAHNVAVRSTGETLAELIAKMDTGLLITEVMGQGVNLITGDYSRGCAGYWVKGGKIQYPVHEITIAGHLSDMFKGIQAVGTDTNQRSSIRTGSILVEQMTVGGVAG